MKITLESTTKIVEINGLPARVWEGRTEKGVECHAFITRIAVAMHADHSQFEAELEAKHAPASAEVEAYPLKLII